MAHAEPEDDASIPEEEERLVERVLGSLRAAAPRAGRGRGVAGDHELLALRDEIGEARLEDVPALVAQMERLQEVSLTRAEIQTMLVDPRSPYFGHLRLRERVAGHGEVERDIFIGRATFTDGKAGVHIVDWRNSLREPTSQPCGHFGSCTPCPCPRGFAAPSPAARGEVSGQDTESTEMQEGRWGLPDPNPCPSVSASSALSVVKKSGNRSVL